MNPKISVGIRDLEIHGFSIEEMAVILRQFTNAETLETMDQENIKEMRYITGDGIICPKLRKVSLTPNLMWECAVSPVTEEP